MSTTDKPDPSAYDGKVTQEQINELERLRVGYVNAKGSANEDTAREAYQDYAVALTIDLSGKLEPGPTQDPDSGFVKPGGWGANPDSNVWVTAKMRAPPDWWKVVDDKGVNVATNFKSQDEAQKYINDHKGTPSTCAPGSHKDPSTGQCVPDQVGPVGDKDQFGILKIHKDKPGGTVNTKFVLEEKQRNYASGKPSEGSIEYTAIAKSNEENSNIEATFYTKINSFKTKEADSLSDKLTGPNHSEGNKSWVIPDFMTDGSTGKTLETESPHPKNHPVNPKPLNKFTSIIGKWFGHKAITWVGKDGERYVESYFHFPVDDIEQVTTEQNEWQQYIPTTKVGKEYVKANGKLMTCRLDGTKKGSPPDFKYCSVREIEPPT